MVVCTGECMCTQRVDNHDYNIQWLNGKSETLKKCMFVCTGECMCTQRVDNHDYNIQWLNGKSETLNTGQR